MILAAVSHPLNMLKDSNFDTLKVDSKFLEGFG